MDNEVYQYYREHQRFPTGYSWTVIEKVVYQIFLEDDDVHIFDKINMKNVIKIFVQNNTLNYILNDKYTQILLKYFRAFDSIHYDTILSFITDNEWINYKFDILNLLSVHYSEYYVDIFFSHKNELELTYYDVAGLINNDTVDNCLLIIEKLLQHNIPVTPEFINEVVRERDIKILKLFIKYNINVNVIVNKDKNFTNLIIESGMTIETLISCYYQ
jgi:hypothetical protein